MNVSAEKNQPALNAPAAVEIRGGPKDRLVSYKRLGQDSAPDGIIHRYEVTYEGLESRSGFFWIGITCAGPIIPRLPPVDPFQQSDQLRALAVAQAMTDLSPIPAGLEGKPSAPAGFQRALLAGVITILRNSIGP